MSDITKLREQLFATLQGVKDGSIDLEKAKAVNEIAKTLTDTARVEVDYLRATGGGESSFLATGGESTRASALSQGIVSVRQHRLAG